MMIELISLQVFKNINNGKWKYTNRIWTAFLWLKKWRTKLLQRCYSLLGWCEKVCESYFLALSAVAWLPQTCMTCKKNSPVELYLIWTMSKLSYMYLTTMHIFIYYWSD
jgi:hypothetical protein